MNPGGTPLRCDGTVFRVARSAATLAPCTGGIDVTRNQRSRSHPEVFAAGDCAQTFHRITGEPIHIALGTHANKQGRVAGSVIGGRAARFPGVLGTAVTKVGELEIGRTGLCSTQAEHAAHPVPPPMSCRPVGACGGPGCRGRRGRRDTERRRQPYSAVQPQPMRGVHAHAHRDP